MSPNRKEWTERIKGKRPCLEHDIRLVACDIDGTLIDESGSIPLENQKAISELGQQGIDFTLVTGRMDRMARLYVKQLSVSLPIIACNGAVIRDCQTNEIIEQTPMDPQDALSLMTYLQQRNMDFLCYSADAVYYPRGSRRIEYFKQYNRRLEQIGDQAIPLYPLREQIIAEQASHWIKILAIFQDPSSLLAVQTFLQQTNVWGAQSGGDALDMMKRGVSKGKALKSLAKRLGIRLEQVAAIGDHENDVTMLSEAGLGIAMAGASLPALKAADVVTGSAGQAGVAQAIRQYILPVKQKK